MNRYVPLTLAGGRRPAAGLFALALLFGASAPSSPALAAGAQKKGAAAAKKSATDAPSRAAVAVVDALYKDHFKHQQNWTETFKRNRDAMAPSLLAMLDADEKRQAANPDEIVGIDFDPLTNAQEEAVRYRVDGATPEGSDMVVAVSVYFGPDPMKVRVKVAPDGASWRIANIIYPESDLVTILREAE